MIHELPTGQRIRSIESMHELLVHLRSLTRIYQRVPESQGKKVERIYHPRIWRMSLMEVSEKVRLGKLYVEKT